MYDIRNLTSTKLTVSIPAHCSSAVKFELASYDNPPTVFIKSLDPNSAAFRAGLRCNDIIQQINGIPIYDCNLALEIFAKTAESADCINVDLVRDLHIENERLFQRKTRENDDLPISPQYSSNAADRQVVRQQDIGKIPNHKNIQRINYSYHENNYFNDSLLSLDSETQPQSSTSPNTSINFTSLNQNDKPKIIKKQAYGRCVGVNKIVNVSPGSSKLHRSAHDLDRETNELELDNNCMPISHKPQQSHHLAQLGGIRRTSAISPNYAPFQNITTTPRIQFLHHHPNTKKSTTPPKHSYANDNNILSITSTSSPQQQLLLQQQHFLLAPVQTKVISTPTRELTLYKKKATSPNFQGLSRVNRLVDNNNTSSSQQQDHDNVFVNSLNEFDSNLPKMHEKLSQSVDCGKVLQHNDDEEDDEDMMDGLTDCFRPQQRRSQSPKPQQRRSSEDLLNKKSIHPKELHKQYESHICCIKYSPFKASEFEQSHSISIFPTIPALKIERRMFSCRSDDAAAEIEFPLANVQMKLIQPDKICLTHPDNGKTYYIMFEDEVLHKCWTAVFRSYISQSPLSSDVHSSKSSRRLMPKDFLTKGKKPFLRLARKSIGGSSNSGNSSTSPILNTAGGASNQIPHSCNILYLANSCLSNNIPSPMNEYVPLLLDLIMDLLERFYPTVSGLYRVSGQRTLLKNAIILLNKPLDEINIDELNEFFSSPKEMANFHKIMLRSFSPCFFGDDIIRYFLPYITPIVSSSTTATTTTNTSDSSEQPQSINNNNNNNGGCGVNQELDNLNLFISELRSKQTEVEINAEAVRHMLKNLKTGQLVNSFDGDDVANCLVAKENSRLQQIFIFYTLKRICRHVAIMSKYESSQMQRLDIMGLSSMLACNMHKSTNTEVTTFINKLLAALSGQYEWYFEESLHIPNICSSRNDLHHLNHLHSHSNHHHLLDPRPGKLPRTSSEPLLDSGLEEGDTSLELRQPGGRSFQQDRLKSEIPEMTGDTVDDVNELALEYVKRVFESASKSRGDSVDYTSHAKLCPLLESGNSVDGGNLRENSNSSSSMNHEIDIDQAISKAIKEGRCYAKGPIEDLDDFPSEDRSEYDLLCRVVEDLYREAYTNQSLREHLEKRLLHYINAAEIAESSSTSTTTTAAVSTTFDSHLLKSHDVMLQGLDTNQVNNRIRRLLMSFQTSREDFIHQALVDFQLLLQNKTPTTATTTTTTNSQQQECLQNDSRTSTSSSLYSSEPSPAFEDELNQLNNAGLRARINRQQHYFQSDNNANNNKDNNNIAP